MERFVKTRARQTCKSCDQFRHESRHDGCIAEISRARRDLCAAPWEQLRRMNDELIILDGCTFMYSDGCGDVEAHDAEGLFYEDVRHLSRWLLRVEGKPLQPLTSRG